jgi:hypothetical protein
MMDGHGAFLAESKRSFPSPWVSFCKLCGLSKLFPRSRWLGRYSLLYLNQNQQHRVDVLAGAFMLIRHEALDKTGLLDESFFMYGEDIDLSYRLVLEGYTNYYVPERILHYKGESTKRNDIRVVKNFYGAMLIFFKKYYRHSGVVASFFIRPAIALMTWIASLKRTSDEGRKKKHVKRRLLILCCEKNFAAIKALCQQRIPNMEHINLWNLDDERVMDAICRRNQMKAFTDIAFCYPDVRYEQILLFMDTLVNKKTTFHIYNRESDRLVSPTK